MAQDREAGVTCDKVAKFGGLDSDKQRQGSARGTRAVWTKLGILNFTQVLDRGLVGSSASGRGGHIEDWYQAHACSVPG